MLELLESLVLVYFLFVNSFYALVLLAAGFEMTRNSREERFVPPGRVLGSKLSPRISILSPAHNEEANVVEAVRALLLHHYPRLEVVVIDDGSRDATLQRLTGAFELQAVEPTYPVHLTTKPLIGLYRSHSYPNLVVASKQNGGKSDALNLGLQLASGELICVVDADTLLEPDGLTRLVRPFLEDERVVAAGGSLRTVNGSRVEQARVVEVRAPRSFVPGVQTVEYIRSFQLGRLGLNRLGGNLIISGAFGLFRRDCVLACGGYSIDTVGEDMELVVRMRRYGVDHALPSRVSFVPQPVAWTEVPESLRILGHQRDRWQRGLCDSLYRHARLCFNPKYGKMGLVAYPYQLLIELCSPLVEAFGWLLGIFTLHLGVLDWTFALSFFLAAYGYGVVLTCLAMLLEERCFPGQRGPRDQLILLAWACLEIIGYRQYLVLARLRGMGRWLLKRSDWGRMERVGFGAKKP